MATAPQLAEKVRAGEYDTVFSSLYGTDGGTAEQQRERYVDALDDFAGSFGASREVSVYSVPGRVELCGNHTDHNNGVVLAAAVNLDIVAIVSKSDSGTIRLRSRGFGDEYAVDLARLESDRSEYGLSSAMIRGVAAGFRERGGNLGGFDAYTVSDVLKGSGLSSSAAFEVCVGTILNAEYNDSRFDAVTLGIIGQYAENVFFGKPSGLMDQITCAAGGTLSIDLKDPSAPVVVEKSPLDLSSHGLRLVVTDTKGDHSNLTDDYAAIRNEMERAASCFGKRCLREVCYDDFLKRVADVREKAGDRAAVRAVHFFEECARVREAVGAAERDDMPRFLELIAESGHSSFEFNQNAYSAKTPDRQGITVGLAVSQAVLRGRGACRLQGGGFAGTIQAFVPEDLLEKYCAALCSVFGDDACHVLHLREQGGIKI
jgi:galactokinase